MRVVSVAPLPQPDNHPALLSCPPPLPSSPPQDEAVELAGGPGCSPEAGLEYLAAHCARLAVVTLGEKGCLIRERGGTGVVAMPACGAVKVGGGGGCRAVLLVAAGWAPAAPFPFLGDLASLANQPTTALAGCRHDGGGGPVCRRLPVRAHPGQQPAALRRDWVHGGRRGGSDAGGRNGAGPVELAASAHARRAGGRGGA